MSYQQQQKEVEADNEERARRKLEDELDIQNEEARARALSHVDNEHYVENPLYFDVRTLKPEFEKNEKVLRHDFIIRIFKIETFRKMN